MLLAGAVFLRSYSLLARTQPLEVEDLSGGRTPDRDFDAELSSIPEESPRDTRLEDSSTATGTLMTCASIGIRVVSVLASRFRAKAATESTKSPTTSEKTAGISPRSLINKENS